MGGTGKARPVEAAWQMILQQQEEQHDVAGQGELSADQQREQQQQQQGRAGAGSCVAVKEAGGNGGDSWQDAEVRGEAEEAAIAAGAAVMAAAGELQPGQAEHVRGGEEQQQQGQQRAEWQQQQQQEEENERQQQQEEKGEEKQPQEEEGQLLHVRGQGVEVVQGAAEGMAGGDVAGRRGDNCAVQASSSSKPATRAVTCKNG